MVDELDESLARDLDLGQDPYDLCECAEVIVGC